MTDMVSNNEDADDFFIIAIGNRIYEDINIVIERYAIIVPERLKDELEFRISSIHVNACDANFGKHESVPDLDSLPEYDDHIGRHVLSLRSRSS
tara:strand:+ start:1819 stop:2100 length:282 start_codon:yes stop_codon:yes gene_type:complete